MKKLLVSIAVVLFLVCAADAAQPKISLDRLNSSQPHWSITMDEDANVTFDGGSLISPVSISFGTAPSNTAGRLYSSGGNLYFDARNLTPTVYNVMDYGAVGDGVTDDWQAIQDAINDSAGGGTVYFPNGDYEITKPLIMWHGVALLGESVELTNITTSSDISSITCPYDAVHDRYDMSIERMSFIKTCTNGAAAIIDATGMSHSTFRDITTRKSGGAGTVAGVLFGYHSMYNLVENVVCRGMATAFHIKDSANANRFINCGGLDIDTSFYFYNSTNNNILIGCYAEEFAVVGVRFASSTVLNTAVYGFRAEDGPLGMRFSTSTIPQAYVYTPHLDTTAPYQFDGTCWSTIMDEWWQMYMIRGNNITTSDWEAVADLA